MLAVSAVDGTDGWARAFGPPEGLDPFDNRATILAVTTDTSGSRYVGGEFFGTVDFDPGAAVVSRAAALPSGFVAKFSAQGGLQGVWTFNASSATAVSKVTALAIAPTGRLAVAGSFSGTVDFNPTISTVTRTAADDDGFALILGSDGSWQNAVTTFDFNVAGWTTSVEVTEIAFASATDLYMVGNYTYSSTTDLSSGDDTYVARIDFNPATIASGVVWQQALGGYAAYAGGLAVDSTGLVISASFSGSLPYVNEFVPGATTDGSMGGIVVSYAANGSPRWAASLPDHVPSSVLPWGDSVIDNALPITVSGDGTTVYAAASEIAGNSTASITRSVIYALRNSGTGAGSRVAGWSPLATSTVFAAASPVDSIARSLYSSGTNLLVGGPATTIGGGAAFLLASVSTSTGAVSGTRTLASVSKSSGDQVNEISGYRGAVGGDRRFVVTGGLAGTASFATSPTRQLLDTGSLPSAFIASVDNSFTTGVAGLTVTLASDTGSSATDGVTKTGTLQVTGAAPGARIEYSVNGGTSWTTTFAPIEGKNSVRVRQVTVSATSATTLFEFTLDTKVATPAVTLANDTGASLTDRITNNGSLQITGVEAGALVQYSVNNGTSWGSTFAAVEGINNVLVRQTDIAGNVSTSATLTFTRDSLAPAAIKATLASDTGVSATDRVTSIGSLTVTGTEVGARLEYSADGGKTWANTFTPIEGKNAIQIRQTDLAGNSSPVALFDFIRDTTAPATPAVSLKTDTGSSSTDKITRIADLALGGIEADARIEYSVNNGATWTSGFAPAPGAVLVRQTDLAGNVSSRSLPFTFTLDTTPSSPPAVTLANDTGTSQTDRLTADASLRVTGLEAGAAVEYSIDNGSTWAPSFKAANGANAVVVRQIDVAGNASLASPLLTFTLDTIAAPPVVSLVSDTGASATDRISAVGTLQVTGAEAGALVQYSVNNGTSWGSTFTAVEGVNTVLVRQNDAAGNISAASTFIFTRDTLAPATPAVSLKTDTGSSSTDKITQIADLALGGIEAGARVEYSVNNGATWTSSFTPAQGAVTVLVRQTDLAGNVSSRSLPFTFTLDTAPPTVRSMAFASLGRRVTVAFDGPVTGVTLANFRISGRTATGSINMLLNDPRLAQLFGTITLAGTDANRIVTFSRITRPTSGSYTLSLVTPGSTIVDAAGNQLATGNSVTFTG